MTIYQAVPGESLDWGSNASWEGAAAPASGSTNLAVFKAPGRYVFTAGMNQSAVNLNGIIVFPGAYVEIPGLTIDLNQSNGEGLVLNGRGTVRIAGGTHTRTLAVSPEMLLRLEGGTHSFIVAEKQARVYATDGPTLEDVQAKSGSYVSIAAKSDRVKLRVSGGAKIETNRNVESADVGRGTLILGASAAVTDGSTGGEARVDDEAGKIILKNTAAATHASIRINAGLLDCSLCAVAPTITNLYRMPGGRVITKCLVGAATISNSYSFGGEGDSAALEGGV